MQRSINKKIGSCLLRFTPSPSPALLTRHHYSHFPSLASSLSPNSYIPLHPSTTAFNNPALTVNSPILRNFLCSCGASLDSNRHYINRSEYFFFKDFFTRAKEAKNIEINDQHRTASWCNFLVFSLKFGVWLTTSSHVMLAEVVHSAADFANQALLAYGLSISRRAPDAIHP
ncbi:hypothetical protein AAG906_021683 [Vitis piasezkii]